MSSLVEIRPQPGMQEFAYLASFGGVGEILMGGEAGPGKSWTLVTMDLPDLQNPAMGSLRILILRRHATHLGDLVDKTMQIYPFFGARFSGSDVMYRGHPAWTFPNGAKVVFGSCKDENDKYDYQGWELQRIRVDEVTQFTESQYLYLFSRLRSSSGIFCNMAASCNPQGLGMLWVMRRFVSKLHPLVVRAFKRVNDSDVETTFDDPDGMTRIWIPGKRADNKYNSDEYLRGLNQLPESDQRALKDGLWEIQMQNRQLINPRWVDRAMSGNVQQAFGRLRDCWSIGCDYANTGKDKSKAYYLHGNKLVDVKTEDYSRADDYASWCALEIKRLGRESTFLGIDAIGAGSGPADNLEGREQMADRLVRCMYKDPNYIPARKGVWEFGNLRSQMNWQFRLDLEDGLLDLSWLSAADCSFDRVEFLLEEMYAHKFYDKVGVMYITPKDDIKDLIGRSPDDYDALVIANWARRFHTADLGPESRGIRGADYRKRRKNVETPSAWL